MSLLWRERLDVLLAPGRLETLRRPGMFGSGRQAGGEECPRREGGEEWRGPLVRLAELAYGRCDLAVLLSSRFVRFQLVPWLEEASDREERRAHAGILFRQVYGPVADGWEILVSEEVPGRAALACAVDRGLLEALRSLSRDKGWRLLSVRPALALAWNRWRGHVSGPQGFFALTEDGGFCLAGMEQGAWLGLRNHRLGAESLAVTLPLVRQELETCGAASMAQAQGFLADLSGRSDSALAPQGWRMLAGGWRDWV